MSEKEVVGATDEVVDDKKTEVSGNEENLNTQPIGEEVESKDDSPAKEVEAKEVEAKEAEAEEDEKRSGLKEVAHNSDVMAIEKDVEVEGEPALPSFFVEEDDRHLVEVDILSSKSDGRIVSISRKGLNVDFKQFDYLNYSSESFEFSLPTYDSMSTYRQRSSVFRNEAQQMVVDRVQLRNFFLVWHLKDWSMRDRKGEKVKLEHDEDGSLTDECMKKVYSVQPTLIDIVMTLFEKDILLT